mmetsp:Transcript_68969/g.192057  ORF Transcript_68969/g.192057 Transcript_68969/m.192057 type:complete len:316 (+) Transcript_68969:209-1156(+)
MPELAWARRLDGHSLLRSDEALGEEARSDDGFGGLEPLRPQCLRGRSSDIDDVPVFLGLTVVPWLGVGAVVGAGAYGSHALRLGARLPQPCVGVRLAQVPEPRCDGCHFALHVYRCVPRELRDRVAPCGDVVCPALRRGADLDAPLQAALLRAGGRGARDAGEGLRPAQVRVHLLGAAVDHVAEIGELTPRELHDGLQGLGAPPRLRVAQCRCGRTGGGELGVCLFQRLAGTRPLAFQCLPLRPDQREDLLLRCWGGSLAQLRHPACDFLSHRSHVAAAVQLCGQPPRRSRHRLASGLARRQGLVRPPQLILRLG